MEILEIKTRRECFLHRMDNRIKILSALIFLFTLVSMVEPYLPAMFFILNLSIMIWLGIPIRKLLYPLYIASVLFVILVFTTVGNPITKIGPLTVTDYGLNLATLTILKILACTSLLLIIAATTPINEISYVFSWMKIPGIVSEIIVLMVRYVDLIAEEFRTIIFALRAKNAFSVNWWRRIYNMGMAAGIILIRSFEKAERVYMAMVARGYDPSKPIVKFNKLGKNDYIKFILVLCLCIFLVFADRVIL